MLIKKSSWLYRWTMWVIAARVEPTMTGESEYIVNNFGYKPFDKCQFFRVAFLWPAVMLIINTLAITATFFSIYHFAVTEIGFGGVGFGALVVLGLIATAAVLLGIIFVMMAGFDLFAQKLSSAKLGSKPKKSTEKEFCTIMEYKNEKD